jgi:hypothetical protein
MHNFIAILNEKHIKPFIGDFDQPKVKWNLIKISNFGDVIKIKEVFTLSDARIYTNFHIFRSQLDSVLCFTSFSAHLLPQITILRA